MIEKINAAGGILGKQVEFFNYDEQGRPVGSRKRRQAADQEDKVVAVIGSNSSGRNIAVAPIGEEAHVPIIATYATNPKVTQPTADTLNKYTFRSASPTHTRAPYWLILPSQISKPRKLPYCMKSAPTTRRRERLFQTGMGQVRWRACSRRSLQDRRR